MIIENEANLSQRPCPQSDERCYIQRLENGIDTNPVTVTDYVREIYRLTAHEYSINLGVRHAQRFDHVLDRNTMFERMDEINPPLVGRQKIIQRSVESTESCSLR